MRAATCDRERTPSLRKTRERWVSTVFSLRNRTSPISRSVRPAAREEMLSRAGLIG